MLLHRCGKPRRWSARLAFTLLELMIVIAILAALAGVTVISVRPQIEQTLIRQAESELVAADAQLRLMSRSQSVPLKLRLDLDHGHLLRQKWGAQDSGWTHLGSRCPVKRIRTAGGMQSQGTVEIGFRTDGSSPDWAYERADGTWCLFLGGSGQMLAKLSPSEVDHVFQAIDAFRAHAH